jgi:trimeric autotransporter adhesin
MKRILFAILLSVVCSWVLSAQDFAQEARRAATLFPGTGIKSPAPVRPDKQGLSSLPAAAIPLISATLGRDDRGYQVCPAGAGLMADNRAQALKAEFTRQGVQMRNGSTELRLALFSYGYGENLQSVREAAPRSFANRVEYQRGPLLEWYVNGPMGLEQGFTLSTPPSHEFGAKSEPLTIALGLRGNVTPSLEPAANGQGGGVKAVALRDRQSQAVIRYAGLAAHDATGRELAANLELAQDNLLIRIHDGGAQYPLTIDPFFQAAKLTGSEDSSLLGYSVAVSSDDSTIVAGVIGASFTNPYQGAAYVFVKPASGWATATQTTRLVASEGQYNDELGTSVALNSNGSVIVAGAPNLNFSPPVPGSAYVFVEPSTGWKAGTLNETAKLAPSDAQPGNLFGANVGMSADGTTIAAGAPNETVNGDAIQGAVYVFVEPAKGGWVSSTETARLTASDGAANDSLGAGVGVNSNGTTIVAGKANAFVDEGSAYVFVKPASGWVSGTQNAELTTSDGGGIVTDVAITPDGGTIVAGAPGANGTNSATGAAYIFVEPGSGWTNDTPTAKLTASDGQTDDYLGYSVAISSDGNTVMAGAPQATVNNNTFQGAAYVFSKPASGWASANQTAKLTASDGAANDQFGWSVAAGGDGSALVGAPSNDAGLGAAYVFLPPAPFTITPTPSTETIKRGVLGGFLLTLKSLNGFKGNVSLSCSGGPAGSYCADFPKTEYLNGTKYAISGILFPKNSAPGTYVVTFTGTSGSLSAKATAAFIVK